MLRLANTADCCQPGYMNDTADLAETRACPRPVYTCLGGSEVEPPEPTTVRQQVAS